jgi:site-specific DNA-cytosine methylase
MRALDLCAGAGGLSLGLQRAGFDVLGIELDADAIETHRRHVGPCDKADLRTYHPDDRRDLTAGGVPCQPFSAAGLGLGLDDPRYLVPDFLRIAREAGSRAVMLENVRGLVKRPRDFRAVLDLFEAEYHTTWTVLDAADQGVPQNRDRVFVVGFKDAADRARFKFPDLTHWPAIKLDGPRQRLADGKRGRRTGGTLSLFDSNYRTVREALSLRDAPRSAGRIEGASGWQGQRLIDIDAPGFAIGTRNNADLLDRPAPCVTATEQKSAMSGSQPMSRRRRASERLSEALEALGQGMRPIDPDRPSATISTSRSSNILDQPAPCVRANSGHEAADKDRASRRPMANVTAAVGAVRLSVEQCALLQGFPPGWTWTGNKSSQHRQIGNAVPPALAEAMGRAVRLALLG